MIQLSDKPVIVQGNTLMEQEEAAARGIDCAAARQNTLAWNILAAHNTAAGDDPTLRLRFDALASHDITYVGIIQTARASGLERFPMPYALTNCHNSLCAVGGTINEDDHLFGLTAARKYGGIFVPPHLAVIHQYAREMMAGCGKMILGSDSHTRYGALGTMAVGEGGPELVKQLLGKTYDNPIISYGGVDGKGKVKIMNGRSYPPLSSHMYCHAPITVTDTNISDFVSGWLDTYCDKDTENGGTYDVTSGGYKTYTKEKYNCFGAVGEWCALMGDSFLKSIHDTKTYKEYFAWPMYKQYHTAWIFDVLNT